MAEDSERPSLLEISADIARDAINQISPPSEQDTPPQGRSLGPDDPICKPVMIERRRRKWVDAAFDKRVRIINRNVRITMYAVLTMVVFAGLEYLGVLGNGAPPIWARAVFDGLKVAVGH
jgi:hypothetical protein